MKVHLHILVINGSLQEDDICFRIGETQFRSEACGRDVANSLPLFSSGLEWLDNETDLAMSQ